MPAMPKKDIQELRALARAQQELETSLLNVQAQISARLREARQYRNLTQSALADTISVSTAIVTLYETKNPRIPLDRLVPMIDALDNHDQITDQARQ